MPTAAPGWPSGFSNHKVSTDTIFTSKHMASSSSSEEQQGDGKTDTDIGIIPTAFCCNNRMIEV